MFQWHRMETFSFHHMQSSLPALQQLPGTTSWPGNINPKYFRKMINIDFLFELNEQQHFHLPAGRWGKGKKISLSCYVIQHSHWYNTQFTFYKCIFSPVHPPRTLIWFDIHLIEVDINLWDFNLEAVGQQFNGLAHGAIAGTSGHHEQGLCPHGSCKGKIPQIRRKA